MSYTADTKNYGVITDPVFIQDHCMGFDFSDKSEVTFIQFNGIGNAQVASVARNIGFWKKYFYSTLGHHVNVVNIRDGTRDYGVYSANCLGVPGICDSMYDLANILNHKLYTCSASTRKTVVFADCGGTIPAICTSSMVPYHSLNLTTPYLRVIGPEHEYDTSAYAIGIARKHAIWAHTDLPHLSQWFDTVHYLDQFAQTHTVQLNMHWATNIIGSDLLFRDIARTLDTRSNVSITDHVMPAGIEGHLLLSHLVSSKKFFQLVQHEVQVQFASLGVNTVTSSRAST